MSIATVAPAAADTTTVSLDLDADSTSYADQRLAAELALANLEQTVQRLAYCLHAAQGFYSAPAPRRSVPRRSRRSAWFPGEVAP